MTRIRSISLVRAAACAAVALALAAGAVPAGAQTVLDPDASVMVTGGAIQGAVSARNDDIVAFKGIPYAAPPVGDRRWRPPEPIVGWEGVRDASESGAICIQNGGRNVTQDEDCLFLNVWAPRETSEPRPVLFWIHGGGYTGGSGSTAIYDGAELAADGAVVVTINYRLNVFGFLAHPALSAESPHGASGNYGLLDMVAALEWVRDNIATFGGDPGRVTIFGESAGGGAVMSVMLMPQAEGLFHGAIAQSNWINGWDRPLAEAARGWEAAEEQGLRVAAALGIRGNTDEALAAMRAASAVGRARRLERRRRQPVPADRQRLGSQRRRLGHPGRPAGDVPRRPAASGSAHHRPERQRGFADDARHGRSGRRGVRELMSGPSIRSWPTRCSRTTTRRRPTPRRRPSTR